MGTVSLRLNDRDDALIRKYAEIHNVLYPVLYRKKSCGLGESKASWQIFAGAYE